VTEEQPKPIEAALRDDPETADLTAKVTEAWHDFTAALAKALSELSEGSRLEVTVDQAALEGGSSVYEVSAECEPAGQLTAYAVGNTMLPESQRLPRTAIAQLVALGWSPPGAGAMRDERYSLALAQTEAIRLSAVLTRTLRDVYGAPHPAFLMYTVDFAVPEEPEGSEDAEVTETTAAQAPEVADAPPAPAVPAPENLIPVLGAARLLSDEDRGVPSQTELSSMSLGEQVATVLAALLKTTPENLPVDGDGDFGIRAGSAMVFVRVREDPPLVDVFSPVLTDVTPTQPLFAKLSELTARLPVGRLYCANNTVWASVPVIGRNFQATHLMLAVQVMTGLADELDDRLHGEFGGKRFFVEADRETAPEPPPPHKEDENGDGHPGMYL
jgi:hypothetical protein